MIWIKKVNILFVYKFFNSWFSISPTTSCFLQVLDLRIWKNLLNLLNLFHLKLHLFITRDCIWKRLEQEAVEILESKSNLLTTKAYSRFFSYSFIVCSCSSASSSLQDVDDSRYFNFPPPPLECLFDFDLGPEFGDSSREITSERLGPL